MSNWGYIGLAYGVTYGVLIGYFVGLMRKRRQALAAIEESGK
jgi:heme exporter protein D